MNLVKQCIADSIAEIKKYSQILPPKVGLIMGSGLSLAEQIEEQTSISYEDLPGFPQTNIAGHENKLIFGKLNGVPVVCMQARAHYYESPQAIHLLVPIRVLKKLGCEVVVLTNSAASLIESIKPGQFAIITDHINFQGCNPLVGKNDDEFGERFPAMDNAYDLQLRDLIKKSAAEKNIPISEAVYFAVLGPSYETPAEIKAFRLLGAQILGMSTVPDVIVARHCGLKVAAIAVISNYAADMRQQSLSHEEVVAMGKQRSKDLANLLTHFIGQLPGGR